LVEGADAAGDITTTYSVVIYVSGQAGENPDVILGGLDDDLIDAGTFADTISGGGADSDVTILIGSDLIVTLEKFSRADIGLDDFTFA